MAVPLLSTRHGHNPPMRSSSPTIDFKRLFKLRLVVARHGEMDAARWWNTQGVLGPRGVSVLRRGFPKTHCFAQARIVFETAKPRSATQTMNPARSTSSASRSRVARI
jgi:hypothetical protein